MAEEQTWTLAQLRRELDRFEAELRATDMAENSVKTYVQRAGTFLRWLAGDYQPRGSR